jgi:hypothetical protein
MVRDAKRRGVRVAVFDPLRDPDWPIGKGDFFTHDRAEFRRFIRTNERRLLVIDESAKALDRYDPEDDWPFTMGRHLGHLAVVIGQYPKMINPVVRSQLTKAYVLALPAEDAAFLAKWWGRPELAQVANFPPLKVMEVSGFSDTRVGTIDFRRRSVIWRGSGKNVQKS